LYKEYNIEYFSPEIVTRILELKEVPKKVIILSLFEYDQHLSANMILDYIINESCVENKEEKINNKNRKKDLDFDPEYDMGCDSEDEPTEMEKTFDVIFKVMKIDVTIELCNRILECGDEKTFEYVARNKLGKFSQESLKYAYKGASYYIIESLINMKFIPTINDVMNMTKKFKEEILELSYAAGVKIDYDTIIMFTANGEKLMDLNKYKLNYGEELYFALYKKNSVCVTKYCKVPKKMSEKDEHLTSKMNKYVLKFRYDFATKSLEELKQLIKETNLIPDQYCYDYSFHNRRDVRSWLEEEYKLKPTILTLTRLYNNTRMKEYVNEYLYDKELYRSNINEIYMSKIYDHNYAILNNMPRRKKTSNEKIVKGKKK